MLRGLDFLICQLFIGFPALLIVGTMIALRWMQSATKKPRSIEPSLVALTVALLPDFVMLVSLFTKDRLIPVIPNSDNVLLFSKWQIISGVLIALAISVSLFERRVGKSANLRASLILLSIHVAGTVLFFSDSLF